MELQGELQQLETPAFLISSVIQAKPIIDQNSAKEYLSEAYYYLCWQHKDNEKEYPWMPRICKTKQAPLAAFAEQTYHWGWHQTPRGLIMAKLDERHPSDEVKWFSNDLWYDESRSSIYLGKDWKKGVEMGTETLAPLNDFPGNIPSDRLYGARIALDPQFWMELGWNDEPDFFACSSSGKGWDPSMNWVFIGDPKESADFRKGNISKVKCQAFELYGYFFLNEAEKTRADLNEKAKFQRSQTHNAKDNRQISDWSDDSGNGKFIRRPNKAKTNGGEHGKWTLKSLRTHVFEDNSKLLETQEAQYDDPDFWDVGETEGRAIPLKKSVIKPVTR